MSASRRSRCTWVCALALVVGFTAATASAKPKSKPIDGRVIFTLDYREGASTPGINPFYYPNTGFRIDHDYFSFEMDTMLVVVIVDAIASLIKWAAGGDDSILLMKALNGDTEPGYYRFFAGTLRYNVLRDKPNWLGVGLSAELSHVDTTFQGVRVPVSPFDLGLTSEVRKQLSAKASMGVAATVGNGWTKYAGFNPFYRATTWLNFKFHQVIGGFARASWKRQRLDFTSYDPLSPQVDPAVVRGKYWAALWTFDVGVSLNF